MTLKFAGSESGGVGKAVAPQADVWSPELLAKMEAPIDEANRFMGAALAGRNCFLTGMAGTGKSTILRRFIECCPKTVDVTAPTGVAALNVGGMTVHRFCGMLLGPKPGQSNEEYFAQLEKDTRRSVQAGFRRVRRCQVLVIDEISMLPGRQLEFIDFLFRRLRAQDVPFGGAQVIVIGDFLQLPPVRGRDEWWPSARTVVPNSTSLNSQLSTLNSPYDWAFRSRTWEEAEFKIVTLEKVHRQDEPAFVRALSEFRVGRVWGESAHLLQSRVRPNPPADMPRLFTHNVQVDKWNNFQLGELPGEETVLEAFQSGPDIQREFLTRNLLTPATLRLKPGAMVMFTVNKNVPGESEPLYVNGQIGKVEKVEVRDTRFGVLNGDGIAEKWDVRVRTGGKVIRVEPFVWSYDARELGSARFVQYPLRLAWAMTIHKAQGLTLDSAYLDIRAAREPGQAYVAVSRVRTLAGLRFKEWPRGLHVSPEAIEFYRKG